jgi:CRISPR-associated protein Csb2
MPVAVTVRLRHGRYDAGTGPGRPAEWPPHPARVFCALAASLTMDGAAESGLSALRWLESQPNPEVWADPPPDVPAGHQDVYVVKNALLSKAQMTPPPPGSATKRKATKSSVQWPARTNGMRSRAFCVPPSGAFAVVWPDSGASAEVLSVLQGLAAGVPYVGRSTSLAEVTVLDAIPERLAGWVVFEPAAIGARGKTWQLAAPYPGYADELAAACDEGRHAHELARPVTYRQAQPADGADAGGRREPIRGPFEEPLVWALARPDRGLDGGQVAYLAGALRAAVMSRVRDPLPPQLSGHGVDDRPHVGFLAIPDVGHPHADGHILGVAMLLPDCDPGRGQLPVCDRDQIVAGVLSPPLDRLRLPGGHELQLAYFPSTSSLRPERWAGPQGGWRTWVTATPMRLDGYPRRGRPYEALVARALTYAGYPEPDLDGIEVSPAPLLPGAAWHPRQSTLPPGRERYPFVHARVRFPVPVAGPMIAGSLRYLGLGLFLPDRPRVPRGNGKGRLAEVGEA